MPASALQQPRNIDDLIRQQRTLAPGSAQEKLAGRQMRSSYLDAKKRRRPGGAARFAPSSRLPEFSQMPRSEPPAAGQQSRPVGRDSQAADMSEGVNRPEAAGGSAAPDTAPDTLRPEEENAAGASLREQTLKKKQDEEKKQADGEQSAAGAAASRGFSGLSRDALRWSWGALATVAGFPFGFAYINAHVFLRLVFGEKLFCKLGDEWTPTELFYYTRMNSSGAGKSTARNAGLMEVMTLLILDIIVGGIVLGALAIVVMIVTWMSEFDEAGLLKKGWIILKGIWDLGFGGMKALVELFSI